MEGKDEMTSDPHPIDQEVPATTVAHQILEEFLNSLAQQPGYEEIASRLKPVILGDKPTEASLREALFEEPPL
jgi:hypothetical protein